MRVPALVSLAVLAALVAGPASGAAGHGGVTTAGHADGSPSATANHSVDGAVNATASRARGALFDDLTTVESLGAARSRDELVRSRFRNGAGSPRPAFVPGDVLVVRIESERLATELRARNGSTPTERYLDYVNRTAARLQVVGTPRTTAPEVQRRRILVNESRIRVLAANDTRWVLLDTGNVTVGYGDDASPRDDELDGGRAYGVWFDFSATAEGLPSVDDRPRVEVVRPDAEFGAAPDHDRAYLSPVANATVRVSSTLAPGTEVTVRARLPNRTVERRVVLLGRNRTAATARFDLSAYEDGRTFRLTALWRGEVIGEATGVVDTPTATLRVGERDPWDAVVAATANLSRGGAVVLRSPDESVRYDSTRVEPRTATTRVLYLPATELSNRTPFAVVAYRSLDDDDLVAGDGVPYREDGSPVRATGVYDPRSAPTVTPTPTALPTTRPATPTATGVGTPVASSPATGGDGAGFGPLPTALAVALVVAVAELVRRRR